LKKVFKSIWILALGSVGYYSCTHKATQPVQAVQNTQSIQAAPAEQNIQGDWIKGSEKEKLATIERQFRGFDNTMVEVGYRYQELYFAGQDQNWEYANYQIDKIKQALGHGFERRPKRAPSGQYMYNEIIPEMKKAIATHKKETFEEAFEILTANCNNCHAMEKMPFFTVYKPTIRQSPIKTP
jgi:hypothetical protein